jgi:hypothetical protein
MEEVIMDDIAKAIVEDGKGILAADESTGTIKKRFDSINVESVEETRRAYREMLFTTAGAAEAISGVILYDETLRQSAADGTPLVKVLGSAGIIPGIKVDTGAKALAGSPDEKVTEGLDGLRERCSEYYEIGGASEPGVHLGQCPRAGPLRRPVPGGESRADRRARGADGRRSRHRSLRRGHRGDAGRGLQPAAHSGRAAGGDAAEAQHGAVGR